ncbi:unnamed protein product [Rotaria magnacalcarata]|uniref:Uncharacterized protein n=1 Tax=Rotaria magnacalcarata TaxID=392030 RepID=A0A816Z8L7_9BILA|nr:unnamed protein product [Rotaria magnacalcarata]
MAGVDEEAKSTQGSFNKRNIADDEYDFVEPIVNEENVENYTTDSEETSVGYHSLPRSVGINDLNNDTQLDIVIANAGTDTVGIFFGYENGTFQPQITYSTGSRSQPYSVAVGDFNSDDDIDIVAATYGSNSISILIELGNGAFEKVHLFSLGSSRPVSVTVADLNNDKFLDIIVVNYGTYSIGILLGYGNALFSIQTKYSTGYDSLLYSVAVADLNGDNRSDIIIANSGANNIAVLVGVHPYCIVVGDFIKDNVSDVIVAKGDENNAVILNGSGNGTFVIHETYFTGVGSTPVYVLTGDLNNDDRLDFATINKGTEDITVFIRYLRRMFSNRTRYSTGVASYSVSIDVGDFNNDIVLDIVVANRELLNVGIFLGYANGTFSIQKIYSTDTNSTPQSVTVVDFNNDSLLDIAVSNNNKHNVGVFLRYDNGSFAAHLVFLTATNSMPMSVAVGDFNKDGLVDIVVANYGNSNIGILLGYENGTFETKKTYSTGNGSFPDSVAVGDLNNDNLFDITVNNRNTGNVSIFLGYGNGSFGKMTSYFMGESWSPSSSTLGGLNNDGFLDIAVSNTCAYNISMLFGLGDGTFGVLTIFSAGGDSRPYSIVIGNFNHDSWEDIAVTNTIDQSVSVFLGLDSIDVANESSYSTGSGSHPYFIVTTDFNNDTILDIVVVNFAHDNIDIRLGTGNGSFIEVASYPAEIDLSPQCVAVEDFNGDFQMDIAIANTRKDSITVALGFGNETFTGEQIYSMGYGINSCFTTTDDLNNDSRPDLVVLNEGTNSVTVLLSFDYATFKLHSSSSTDTGSYHVSIAVGDLNNDSVLDIVVANRNTNNVGVYLGYDNGSFTAQIVFSTELLS